VHWLPQNSAVELRPKQQANEIIHQEHLQLQETQEQRGRISEYEAVQADRAELRAKQSLKSGRSRTSNVRIVAIEKQACVEQSELLMG